MSKIIEFLPIIVFFGLYKFFDIFVATAGICIATILTCSYEYIKTKTLSRFQLINSIVLISLSLLTLLMQDSSFVKMKPTIIYSLLAGFLILDIFVFEKFYIQKLYRPILQKHSQKDFQNSQWKKLSLHWIVFLCSIAALNEFVWRNMDESTWVNFKVFCIPLLITVIITTHIFRLLKS